MLKMKMKTLQRILKISRGDKINRDVLGVVQIEGCTGLVGVIYRRIFDMYYLSQYSIFQFRYIR